MDSLKRCRFDREREIKRLGKRKKQEREKKYIFKYFLNGLDWNGVTLYIDKMKK